MHTYLQVLLDHGQFQPLDGLRVIRVGLDAFAHDVPRENAHAVLALSIDWFTSLEELLSQVIDLPETGHKDGPQDSQQDAPSPVPVYSDHLLLLPAEPASSLTSDQKHQLFSHLRVPVQSQLALI